MNKKTTSELASVLVNGESSEGKLTKQLALSFAVYCGIVNLKMVAMLNEQASDGEEPADEFLEAILTGWYDAAVISFEAELAEYDKLTEDPLVSMFSSMLGTKEDMEELFTKSLDTFYTNMQNTIK